MNLNGTIRQIIDTLNRVGGVLIVKKIERDIYQLIDVKNTLELAIKVVASNSQYDLVSVETGKVLNSIVRGAPKKEIK